LISYGDIWL